MTDVPTIAIATQSEPVRESLSSWCTAQGITIGKDADIWLVDGHHTPTDLPTLKGKTVLLLGPIPAQLTPNKTIPTPASFDDIRAAIAAYMQPSTIALRPGWSFDLQRRTLSHADQKPINLTEKEAALLQQLLQAMPAEISRETLLKNIWAYDKDVDTHTVETHIYRLRQKCETASEQPFDILTLEQGYKVTL